MKPTGSPIEVGTRIRVVDSFRGHSTRWGGMEGRVIGNLIHDGVVKVKVRNRLNRDFTVPVSQCKVREL